MRTSNRATHTFDPAPMEAEEAAAARKHVGHPEEYVGDMGTGEQRYIQMLYEHAGKIYVSRYQQVAETPEAYEWVAIRRVADGFEVDCSKPATIYLNDKSANQLEESVFIPVVGQFGAERKTARAKPKRIDGLPDAIVQYSNGSNSANIVSGSGVSIVNGVPQQ